jgi:hypothetical protein
LIKASNVSLTLTSRGITLVADPQGWPRPLSILVKVPANTCNAVTKFEEEMAILNSVILNLLAALGIGLLIGAERERHKGKGPSRSPAGIRTFTVASLADSFTLGGELLLAVTTAGVAALTALAYSLGPRPNAVSIDELLDQKGQLSSH